jgi:peptide/nickel transport system permease protein
MGTYLLRRGLYMIVTLFFISIIGFILINLPPGSALDNRLNQLRAQGGDLSMYEMETLRKQYGLDDQIEVKYVKWMGGVLHGDFGQSFTFGQPVGSLIWGRFAFTVVLSLSALIFAWVVAVPVGVYSATHRYNMPDYVITVLQFVGVAVPEFLLALLLMVFASGVLHQDVGGLFSQRFDHAAWSWAKFVDLVQHLWIPVLVIAAASTAGLTRVMRANLLDVLNYQYVQTARAKGLQESIVIWKHAVRNALHPLVMALGTSLPVLLSGEVIVSIVLNLPSDGPLYNTALQNKDMYLAITFLLLSSVLLVVGNLIADLLLVWLDPRVRLE